MMRVFIVLGCVAACAAGATAEVVEFVVDPALTRWSVRGAYYRVNEEGQFAAQFGE